MIRVVTLAAALLVPGSAMADEPPPPPPPTRPSPVVWLLDVRDGAQNAEHGIWPQGGAVPLGSFDWSCRYSAIAVSTPERNTGMESVTLTCTRGDAIVQSDVACMYLREVQKPGRISGPNQARLHLSAKGSNAKRDVYLLCLVPKGYYEQK